MKTTLHEEVKEGDGGGIAATTEAPPPASSDDGGDEELGEGFQTASAESLTDILGDDFAAPAGSTKSEGISPSSVTEPGATAKPETPKAPEPVAAPVTPPTEPVAAQPPVAAAPVAPTPEPQPVTPAVEPAQPPAETKPTRTPEELAAERMQHRTEWVDKLTQAYTIPETDLEELRDNPEKYLPKMAARLHADVFDSLYNGIVQQLPVLFDALMTGRGARQKDEERFFGMWGKLNTPQLRPQALEKVKQYRQLNPTMPVDQFLHEAGMWAHMALKVPMDAPAAPGNGGAAPTPTPTPTPAATRQQPFQPAGAGVAAGGVPLAPTKDPWGSWLDELAQD